MARYGWLYAVIVAWCAALTVAAILILLHRCRLSQCRKLWYVPVVAILLGFSLLLAYFVAGGAPTLAGRKLYNLHEAFAFTFILLWESCIQIGLIPANTDYGALFRLSHLSAALVDRDRGMVYQAEAFVPADGPQKVQREHPIPGGKILWTEDRSAIQELNEAGVKILDDYKSDLIVSGRYRRKKVEKIWGRYIGMPVNILAVSVGTGEFLDEGNY